MKSSRSLRLFHAAIGMLAAICASSQLAGAQTVSARFTLPFEAQWGLATLPPGNYSLTVEGVGREAKIRIARGAETVANLQNQNFSVKPSSEVSLKVVQTSAGNFVRDLTLPEIGEVFYFAAPKNWDAAARERKIARVSVTTASR
jgi:hypothetical protein